MYSVQTAVALARKCKSTTSSHTCAKSVRQYINAGGLQTPGHPVAAQDYAEYLPKIGFTKIASVESDDQSFRPKEGDIAVMSHGKYGHICMWDGDNWVSDFRQNKMYPYSGSGKCDIFRYM